MNSEVSFLVRGSERDPYCVRFQPDQSGLIGSCTCQGGRHGKLCKHLLGIVEGAKKLAVSDDLFAQLVQMPGFEEVERLIGGYRELEKEVELAKKKEKSERAKIERKLLGR